MLDKVIVFRCGNISNDGRPEPTFRILHANHIGRVHIAQQWVKPRAKIVAMKKSIKEHAHAGSGKSSAEYGCHNCDCQRHNRSMVTPLPKNRLILRNPFPQFLLIISDTRSRLLDFDDEEHKNSKVSRKTYAASNG